VATPYSPFGGTWVAVQLAMDRSNAHSLTLREQFARLASWASRVAGTFWAFTIALGIVIVWALTGPIFHFSDTWQLVINTGTTIVTFLMVFLIQHAQNRDMKALHLKLNELVAAVGRASNQLIDAEDLSEDELESLGLRYRALAERLREEGTNDPDAAFTPTRRRARKRRSHGSDKELPKP
jgi:low affinity Fe/Cu permease